MFFFWVVEKPLIALLLQDYGSKCVLIFYVGRWATEPTENGDEDGKRPGVTRRSLFLLPLAMTQASLAHFLPSALPPCTPFSLSFWNPSLPSPCRLPASLPGAGAADLQFNWSQVLR